MTTTIDLSGKTALVTGAGRGIGREIALTLAAAGAAVAVNDFAGEELCRAVVAEIEALGAAGLVVMGDVGDEQSVAAMVDRVEAELGPLGIVVNNAGITRDNVVMLMSPDEFDGVVRTHLRGTFLVSKAVARKMLRRREGAIVNISSVVGRRGNAGQANYAAAKAGIIGLTKSLAKELGARSIRVNAVAPGYIDTAMTQALPDAVKQAIVDNTPEHRTRGNAAEQCTRGELEGPLPIRRLKRFIADQRYDQAEPKAVQRPEQNGKKVAVVGSGPAGLTAAWQLRAQGLRRQDLRGRGREPVGMLRLGIPALPPAQRRGRRRCRERHSHRRRDRRRRRASTTSPSSQTDGFDAVLVATGTHTRLSACACRARSSTACGARSAFLADVKLGKDRRPGPARTCSWSAAATWPSTRRARARRLGRRGGRTRSAWSAARRCRPTTSRSRKPRPRASRCTTAGASTTSSGDGRVQARRAQGLHLRVRPRGPLPPRVRRGPARHARLRRRRSLLPA